MMMVPTIHLNGTPHERLMEQVSAAREALRATVEALSEMTPNGRDYYPQGEGAFDKAAREHAARIQKISAVDAELAELQWAIAGKGMR